MKRRIPKVSQEQIDQVLGVSSRKGAKGAKGEDQGLRDYACLTEFVMRLSMMPCERWIYPHTCLNEKDGDPCWPCQAMALERQMIHREGEQRCRVCGCLENCACTGLSPGETCHWVEPDLCSDCAEVLKEKGAA